jgi:predicted transcriptional regulator
MVQSSGGCNVSARVSQDTYSKLQKLASIENVSVSAIVRKAIEKYLTSDGSGEEAVYTRMTQLIEMGKLDDVIEESVSRIMSKKFQQ